MLVLNTESFPFVQVTGDQFCHLWACPSPATLMFTAKESLGFPSSFCWLLSLFSIDRFHQNNNIVLLVLKTSTNSEIIETLERNITFYHVFCIYYISNWSMMKRSILIGSLSGPNFVLQTAKMDRSQINFAEFLLWNMEQKKTVFYDNNFIELTYWGILFDFFFACLWPSRKKELDQYFPNTNLTLVQCYLSILLTCIGLLSTYSSAGEIWRSSTE